MARRPGTARAIGAAGAALAIACALLPTRAPAGFSSVEPASIEAGSFYAGATLQVRGSIGERSQVAIRVSGPLEHHAFNRRGKIAGIMWGGIEHVSFRNAPSLFAIYTSAALAAVAPPAVRDELQLGYDTLATRISVEGTRADEAEMFRQFVRLKESEGLYRLAPGAVRLGDAERGRRPFEAAVTVPSTAGRGSIEVAIFELADGAVVNEDLALVELRRVGMPAYLERLAHERGTMFGLLAVVALLGTGLAVDLLGSWRGARAPHPVVVVLGGLVRVVDDAAATARPRLRSPRDVSRLHAKYRRFRALLALNHELLELLTELEEESSWTSFRHARVRMNIRALFDGTADMVGVLNELSSNRYFDLGNVVASLRSDVWKILDKGSEHDDAPLALTLRDVDSSTARWVGGKAVNLARIEYDLGFRVPEAFAVTIEAYREFLELDDLATQLRTILSPARLDVPDDFRWRCELAQGLIRQARVPATVVDALRTAHRACGFRDDEPLAVRSSAPGEGGALSFAGQFESMLNVPAAALADAWKNVVASRFSPRAVFYRRAAGLAEVDTPMGVLVQRMVRARASGVLFTRRPEEPRGPALLITAVQGLGPEVSAGIASADQLVVSRSAPHRILERRVARKPTRLVGAEGGGVAHVAVTAEEQVQASITDDEAVQLAAAALAIERYFGAPQDIEWAFDEEGRLCVLQARPLRIEKASPVAAVPPTASILLHGGEPAWPGRAVGPVHVARTPEEEERTPEGAILVVPQLLPDCVRVLPRVCGIVVERGTVTGHAASILREFRVPSLFGVPGALETLLPGQLVSLDAGGRGVFGGELWPELRGHLPVSVHGRTSAGLPELLAGKLTKLTGSAFVGTWACQSLHDVIRFAHEMAIESMFDVGDRLLQSPIGGVKRLECAPPLYMHVVDIGGGITPEGASKETVTAADVASVPFQGLWRGLSDPHFEPQRSQRPGRFWSVLATTVVDSESRRALGAPNYACITDDYLNLNSRQAYHFVVVDSFLSENQNNNHVSVRLKGGGAAPWQRHLRAEFAAEVLRRHRFTVSVTGDLMSGWMRGVDRATGLDELAVVGHLLRFLARLDMWMTGAADVKRYVEIFVEAEAAALAASKADCELTA